MVNKNLSAWGGMPAFDIGSWLQRSEQTSKIG
jgi:hypothetical protein